MPDQLTWNEFKSGWIPSDDAVNGRKDGCLQMDNLELDKNGALTLTGGTQVVGTTYPFPAHTIFSVIVSGIRYDYVADQNGAIYRNGVAIGAAGDHLNAAFAVAYNYVLMASGNTRFKDIGIGTPVLLGLSPAALPTAVRIGGANYTATFTPSSVVNVRNMVGSGSSSADFLTGGADSCIVQSSGAPGGGSVDWSKKVTLFSSPQDSTDILGGASIGIFQIFNFTANSWSSIDSVIVDILLDAPSGVSTVNNFFRAQWNNPQLTQSLLLQAVYGFVLPVNLTRNDFTRYGNSNVGWESVKGFRLTINTNSVCGFSINFPQWFQGGLIGDYEWIQVNVNASSGYTGKSVANPTSASLSLNNQLAILTPQDVTSFDPQINQLWFFRRGGGLNQWYRTSVITDKSKFSSDFYDTVSDEDALTTGIIFDPTLISAGPSFPALNIVGIPTKIFDIIGPIEGRWLYFTSQFMYPSDINDPDLVQPGLAVSLQAARTGNAEIYLWARKIADNAILVGTSLDVHILTGTFVSLPDGTIDIFYRSLGCAHPPVTNDATTTNGSIIYLAADGWRSIDGSGACHLLVAPNTDRIYRNITCYGYGGIAPFIAGSGRFPCVVAKNKLWCCITGRDRLEVLDSLRAYWRPLNFNISAPTAICATPDGQVLVFSADKKLRLLDIQSTSLTYDGIGQPVKLLSPVFDGGTPRQRKDLYTLKVRANTGGSNLAISVIDDVNVSHLIGNVNTNSLIETNLDVSQILAISKWVQFSLSGSFTNLTFDDLTLFYDTRPIPLTFARIYNQNFGNSSKKRIRVWPLMLDARGGTVLFTPFVDNTNNPTTQLTGAEKTTLNTFFKTDVFGIDYGATLLALDATKPFEFWGMMNPDIVQVLPIARQFDQVGPEELFRYGRIKQFEIRILPFGTSIPWTMYFNDNSTKSGAIVTIQGQEGSYFIGLPMGAGGQIVRIEFGPTNFNFHRFYVRLQVMKTGKNTEEEWVTLPDPLAGL